MRTDIFQGLLDQLRTQRAIIERLQFNVGVMIGYIEGKKDCYKFNQNEIKVIHFNADYKNPDQEEDEKQKKSGG